jgi:hypothetical protein
MEIAGASSIGLPASDEYLVQWDPYLGMAYREGREKIERRS